MKKAILLSFCLINLHVLAQESIPGPAVINQNSGTQPLLFSLSTITADQKGWNIFYSGSFGQHVVHPFGYNGLDQHISLKGYLGSRLTLFVNAGFGFNRSGGTSSLQQAEIISDFIGGKTISGLRIGAGIGGRREWSGDKVLFSRITSSYNTPNLQLGGNLLIEKAFNINRDKLDLISSMGFHHKIASNFFAGLEAIGEDLEGLWDKEETEGGAKLFLGPSLKLAPAMSRLSFSLAGGPIFYATKSTVLFPDAQRSLIKTDNGYTIKFMIAFGLNQK
jgi:hypothetical protein